MNAVQKDVHTFLVTCGMPSAIAEYMVLNGEHRVLTGSELFFGAGVSMPGFVAERIATRMLKRLPKSQLLQCKKSRGVRYKVELKEHAYLFIAIDGGRVNKIVQLRVDLSQD